MRYEMDYGCLEGSSAPLQVADLTRRSQVYLATHNGEDERLRYMQRSFISFSFGGKNIEDFGLIATIDGDRMQRNVYADFTDNVTESDILNGQLYWGTHYKANTISFILATDGITERELDMFKHWFQPGKMRELILAEHPNRGIMARVSAVPSMSVLPFEHNVNVVVGNTEYPTSTTLYKGTISLSFIMDDPFWYSLSNILDIEATINGERKYESQWIDVNGNVVDAFSNKDSLKILYEDDIGSAGRMPKNDAIIQRMFFGNGQLLSLHESQDEIGSYVDNALVGQGHIAYLVDISDVTNIHLGNKDEEGGPAYFYYCGTAPSAPTISFELKPILDNNGYIISPKNSICTLENDNPYNKIVIETDGVQEELLFTTPSVYTAYNQVIYILDHIEEAAVGSTATWEDVKALIRDKVKHYLPRKYAINLMTGKSGAIESVNDLVDIKTGMTNMLKVNTTDFANKAAEFQINCQNGQVIAFIHNPNDPNNLLKENVGDMILSDYLLIDQKNYLDAEGHIQHWTAEHPECSYIIYTDVEGGLDNFDIRYKFLYL